MKLSRLILCFLCLGLGNVSDAFAAADAGLRYIQTRGTVRCGTDLRSKFYAYKDEDGFWHGLTPISAKTFCWPFSTAASRILHDKCESGRYYPSAFNQQNRRYAEFGTIFGRKGNHLQKYAG